MRGMTMEFEIKVNIDWIDDDGGLDDIVKDQVVQHIVDAICKQQVKEVTDKALRRINAKLDELVTELFQSFMQQKITITDEWGDAIKKDIQIEELMKEKLEKALGAKVDKRGRSDRYGNETLLEYMISKKVAGAVNDVSYIVDKKIEKQLTEGIREKLGDTLLGKLNVEKTVKEVIGRLQG
jgi:TnpA family transposase